MEPDKRYFNRTKPTIPVDWVCYECDGDSEEFQVESSSDFHFWIAHYYPIEDEL